MRYKCLFLDYDDTVVNSSKAIHHTSFVEAMHLLRPGAKEITFEEFMLYCAEPGFVAFRDEIIGMDEEEQKEQQRIWKDYTERIIPPFFEGMGKVLTRFHEAGGIIVAVSHSEERSIRRTYETALGFAPDLIFGWDYPVELRKPSTYPVEQSLQKFGLSPEDCLVVDDLLPGREMARKAGIDFCYAGWSGAPEALRAKLIPISNYTFDTVEAFERWLFK